MITIIGLKSPAVKITGIKILPKIKANKKHAKKHSECDAIGRHVRVAWTCWVGLGFSLLQRLEVFMEWQKNTARQGTWLGFGVQSCALKWGPSFLAQNYNLGAGLKMAFWIDWSHQHNISTITSSEASLDWPLWVMGVSHRMGIPRAVPWGREPTPVPVDRMNGNNALSYIVAVSHFNLPNKATVHILDAAFFLCQQKGDLSGNSWLSRNSVSVCNPSLFALHICDV